MDPLSQWPVPDGELGGPGDRSRAVSCRIPEPSSRTPTGRAQALRWQRPLPHPGLRNLQSVLSAGPAPPRLSGWPEEPKGPLGPGHLAPSVMTAGQGLGAWPWGSRQLGSPPLSQNWTSERESCTWGPGPFFFSFIYISWSLITLQYCSGFCHTLIWISPFLSEQRITFIWRRFTGACYLAMTWP